MKITSFNVFSLIAYPISFGLCILGEVSWWVLLMITLLNMEYTVTFGK